MKKNIITLVLILFVLFSVQIAFGQDNEKTSNKELLIKATQILEAQPFHEKAKDFRSWAMKYVIETDDVSVVICGGQLLDAVMDKKNKYNGELLAQYTIAMAAFKLSNPDQAKNENAAQLAGMESMLKAYEAMVKEKSKAKFNKLEELITKRNNDELKKFVEDSKCGEGKKEEIK